MELPLFQLFYIYKNVTRGEFGVFAVIYTETINRELFPDRFRHQSGWKSKSSVSSSHEEHTLLVNIIVSKWETEVNRVQFVEQAFTDDESHLEPINYTV